MHEEWVNLALKWNSKEATKTVEVNLEEHEWNN